MILTLEEMTELILSHKSQLETKDGLIAVLREENANLKDQVTNLENRVQTAYAYAKPKAASEG